MKKALLSTLLLALPLLANAYDVEVDGICYNLNSDENVAEMTHLHWFLGEIVWDMKYRFASENNTTGEECYAFPAGVWERLKTETFYVTIKGDNPQIHLIDGWWDNLYTGDDIMPGNEDLTDNGDGTSTLAVNLAGSQLSDVMNDRHLLFTGQGYSIDEIYFLEKTKDGNSGEEEKFVVWNNGTFQSDTAVIPETITVEGVEYTVTSIAEDAFGGGNDLLSVIIPKSVTNIAVRAFNGCRGLASIIVESGNTKYDSRKNCNAIIETRTNILIAGCKNTVIPSSVKEIGEAAFYCCSNLTSVAIPNSVTKIGLLAFFGCGLTAVNIPNSVTTIGGYAFSRCTDLATVVIPSSMTSIGEYAFSFCFWGLNDVYCYAQKVPDTFDGNLFELSPIEESTLHVPANSINDYGNTAPWSGFGNIVPLTDDDQPTGIKTENGDDMASGLYYSIDGKRSTTPRRGLYFIKMNDGTTRKVVVK